MTEDNLFTPLEKSITLLVVDDDDEQLDFYDDMISEHPAYNVLKANSAVAAEKHLRSDTPPHLCILDLGIDDIGNDEFFLLKRYGSTVPFVIISGSADMERAFTASKLGAAGMVAKPPDMLSGKFWDQIASVFLNRTILPDVGGMANPVLRICCAILHEDLPENVSDWAGKGNITDTYLRKLWMDCFTVSPKHILFIYKLYKYALSWFNDRYISEVNDGDRRLSAYNFPGHQQLLNYYLINKRVLDGIRDKHYKTPGAGVTTVARIEA